MTVTGYDPGPMVADNAVREIPARREVDECGEQLDKLTALVAQLEDRLDWARYRRPQRDGQDVPAEKPAGQDGSQLVVSLRSHVDQVKRLQHRLATLLAELEI